MRHTTTGGLLAILLATAVGAQSPTFGPGASEAEILRIREQMRAEGHGPPEYPPHSYSDSQFAGEIQRLSAQQNERRPAEPDIYLTAPRQHGDRPDRKHLLRETAFQLDTLAHRLEMQDLCGQADQLRRVAGQLRQDARGEGFSPGPVPSLPPQAPQAGTYRPGPAPLFFPGGRSRVSEPAAEEPRPAVNQYAQPEKARRRDRDRPRPEEEPAD